MCPQQENNAIFQDGRHENSQIAISGYLGYYSPGNVILVFEYYAFMDKE